MAKTLAQIRAKVRYYIDELEDTSPVTWANAELNAYINDAQQFLLSEMMKVNPDYSLYRSTAPTVASQGAYPPPSDLYGNKLRGLWAYVSSASGRWEVQYKSNDTIMAYQHITGRPAYYTIIDGGIVLAPVPDSVYTLEMWYTARPIELALDGSNSWFRDEEVEALAAWAAVKALNRIDRDATKVVKQLDVLMAQVKANISQDDNLAIDYNPLDMT
jgi:hypothetical protein